MEKRCFETLMAPYSKKMKSVLKILLEESGTKVVRLRLPQRQKENGPVIFGYSHPADRTIYVPPIRKTSCQSFKQFALFVTAHECGHVRHQHYSSKSNYIEEYEADSWGIAMLAGNGIKILPCLLKWRKATMRHSIKIAIEHGAKHIDQKVARWAQYGTHRRREKLPLLPN